MKIYIYLAAAVAGAAGVWYVNHLRVENNQFKAANESLASQLVRQKLSESANFAVITKLNNQFKTVSENYERVSNEINNYRDELNTCRLNYKWVQLHNTAAKVSTAESAAAINGATAADALDTINHNYRICYQWRAVAEEWQDWYKQQEQVYNDQNFSAELQ